MKPLITCKHHPRALLLACGLVLLLSACGTSLPQGNEPGRHLPAPAPSSATGDTSAIPQVVTPLPLLEPPQAEEEPELYTVVAQDVPVRDVLFTMARDAAINVDVHPSVTGSVSLNAIAQTLPQIMERISRQIDMRWRFDESGNLVVEADSPFWRTYRVDYVNITRNSTTGAEISTAIAGGGDTGSRNVSNTSLSQSTNNDFWATLPVNLANLLGEASVEAGAISSIVANPESGVVSVRATGRQHEQVAAFLNSVQTRSLYQVLIEATVVEVNLNDQYQAGVDWAMLNRNNGEISFEQIVTGADLSRDSSPTNILTIDKSGAADAITATISLLSQFGELRVLSSPKIMALNNQTAMLRVVDNSVYFTVEVQPGVAATANSGATQPVYTTTVNTVPVGFTMTVTPQVSENDQVTLNVRPTISRIVGYILDPNPILKTAGVESRIPQTQLREFESVMKVYSGQVAILGGLMQDSVSMDEDGVPVLSRLPGVGGLFSYRNEKSSKTELIIFIRPVVIRQPSLQGDLADYSGYLPANGLEAAGPSLPEGMPSLPGSK